MGAVGNAGYCASKAAVIGVSRTAAKENQGIRVNCVSPGRKSLSSTTLGLLFFAFSVQNIRYARYEY